MAVRYALTPEMRIRLKRPLGILIKGSFVETMRKFKDIVDDQNPPIIVSVGDTVSKNLAKNSVIPKLSIVDNKCMRRSIKPATFKAEKIVYVKNPQGTITDEAITGIHEALNDNRCTKMIVDGEEDLLTLIAIANAPEESLIIYGQPYEGIVVVKVTPEKRTEIYTILNGMEKSSKS